jgi:hypothetical protein
MLDSVRVASPCNASWDKMIGDDHVRFCTSCEKNVYNLSAMSRQDAERLLEERAGAEMCVRFYQRADGTMMTEDCPVGVKKKRRKKLALAIAGAGAMAAAAVTSMSRAVVMQGAVPVQHPEPVMGEMVPPQQPEVTPAPPPHVKMGKRVAVPTPAQPE